MVVNKADNSEPIEDDIGAIKAVTVDDVHSLIEQFNPADFTQLSIGPAKGD